MHTLILVRWRVRIDDILSERCSAVTRRNLRLRLPPAAMLRDETAPRVFDGAASVFKFLSHPGQTVFLSFSLVESRLIPFR